MNNNINVQKGVGLIEVLVAMLLLAVGVLGFAALQVESVAATAESAQKTQAINLMMGFVEKLHINVRDDTKVTAQNYADMVASPPTVTPKKCLATTTPVCTAQELATKDVWDVTDVAKKQGMTLHMERCPNMSTEHWCLFAAWNNTQVNPSGYGSDPNTSCMRADGRTYWAASTCVMMGVL